MPTPLVTQHYPHDFQIITLGLNTTGDGADQAMFYADRNIVIDSVIVGTSVADTGATCAVKYATSPVAATIASGSWWLGIVLGRMLRVLRRSRPQFPRPRRARLRTAGPAGCGCARAPGQPEAA